jgi:hypothetical protein
MDSNTSRENSRGQPSALVAEEHGYEADFEQESSSLLNRIHSGIEYTSSRLSKNLPLMQSTRFLIPLRTTTFAPSKTHVKALSLLRSSSATIIRKSTTDVVFELGMPIPYVVPQGAGMRLIHSPHWWVGKSTAEMKAGPHAEEKDVRRATANLKGQETKKRKKVGKTAREREIEAKLAEGLRRMKARLRMWDDGDDTGRASLSTVEEERRRRTISTTLIEQQEAVRLRPGRLERGRIPRMS